MLIYLHRNLYGLLFDGQNTSKYPALGFFFVCGPCVKTLRFPNNKAPASTAHDIVVDIVAVATIGHAGSPPLEAINGKLLTTTFYIFSTGDIYNPIEIKHCKKDFVGKGQLQKNRHGKCSFFIICSLLTYVQSQRSGFTHRSWRVLYFTHLKKKHMPEFRSRLNTVDGSEIRLTTFWMS